MFEDEERHPLDVGDLMDIGSAWLTWSLICGGILLVTLGVLFFVFFVG